MLDGNRVGKVRAALGPPPEGPALNSRTAPSPPLTCPREGNSGEGLPSNPPTPRFPVFGEEPDRGVGDKPVEERRLAPPAKAPGRGFLGAGARASQFLWLKERPSPLLAPACIKSR